MSAARSSSELDEVAEPVPRLDVEERAVRARCGLLGDQVAERGVAVLVDRGVQADVLAAPGQQVEDPLDVHVELGGDLLRLRVTAELALEGAARGADLVELLDDVHGQPHDAGLLGDAAGDRLPHPPGGVGGELVALGVVELLDRADQAGVALLDQVEHRHLAAAVLAGDGDDEPEVGLDEALDGPLALLGEPLELLLGGVLGRATLLAADAALGEQVLGEQAGLDGLAELDLGDGVEQRSARDLVEVHPDAVAALDLTAGRAGRSRCGAMLPRCVRSLPVAPRTYPAVAPCNHHNDERMFEIPEFTAVHPGRPSAVSDALSVTTYERAREVAPSGTFQGLLRVVRTGSVLSGRAPPRGRSGRGSRRSAKARSRQEL